MFAFKYLSVFYYKAKIVYLKKKYIAFLYFSSNAGIDLTK